MDVARQVFGYFREHGLSPAAAAGIVGNTQQESSNNPNAPGGGLIQGQGGRTSHGTLQQQLNGVWGELRGPERSTLQALRAAHSPQEAARIFSERFERPGIPMLSNRERYAQEALSRYAHVTGAQGLGGGGSPVQGQEPSSGQPMAAAGGSDVLAGLLAAVRTQAAQPQPMQLGSPARPAASAGPILPGGSHAPAAFSPAQPSQDQSLVKLIEAAQASAASSSPEATAGGAEAGGGGGSAGYVNPLPGFTKGRTDQGVDYSARPGAPIKALGNGRVLKTSPNWYAGQPYVSYELTDGPRKGQVIYVAEQIVPHVSEGQHVRAGQTIGVYAPTGTGVETGLGTRTPGVVKTPYNGRADGSETSGGIEARKLLESLGAR